MKDGYLHSTERVAKVGEFTTVIDLSGKFYEIAVCWRSGFRTRFRDSMKKLPMSVARVAKAFDLPESKGEIVYTDYRAPGHELTDEERSYIHRDVLIPARALDIQFKAGMSKMTVGADSLAEYKRTNPRFKNLFPVLDLETDAQIRKAYRGGFTYADPRFATKRVGPGRVYDVNSLYPYAMYSRPLPYGVPIWVAGEPIEVEDRPLYIATLTFTAKIKPNHIPCIQIKGSSYFIPTIYQTEITEPTTLSVTSVDLNLWRDQYDITVIEYLGCWYFPQADGLFKAYIDKWMEVKANSVGGMRQIAKLHLNSLYGKFATNPDVTGKVPYLEDGVVSFKMGPEQVREPVYTPMAAFITAYAREVTIRAAQAHYDVFAYADTDSLHLLVDHDPPGLDIDPVRLGAWKRESMFDEAVFMRAKQYCEYERGVCTCGALEKGVDHERGCGYTVHIAGLPYSAARNVTLDDMVPNHVFTGKLLPKRVPGGVVLNETTFRLRI